jgi:hypothetical protein
MDPDVAFVSLERKPVASGSIAQIHRGVALVGGVHTAVAVKVVHPGVVRSIELDFRVLGLLAATVPAWASRGLSLKESLSQFSHTMTAQVWGGVDVCSSATLHTRARTHACTRTHPLAHVRLLANDNKENCQPTASQLSTPNCHSTANLQLPFNRSATCAWRRRTWSASAATLQRSRRRYGFEKGLGLRGGENGEKTGSPNGLAKTGWPKRAGQNGLAKTGWPKRAGQETSVPALLTGTPCRS